MDAPPEYMTLETLRSLFDPKNYNLCRKYTRRFFRVVERGWKSYPQKSPPIVTDTCKRLPPDIIAGESIHDRLPYPLHRLKESKTTRFAVFSENVRDYYHSLVHNPATPHGRLLYVLCALLSVLPNANEFFDANNVYFKGMAETDEHFAFAPEQQTYCEQKAFLNANINYDSFYKTYEMSLVERLLAHFDIDVFVRSEKDHLDFYLQCRRSLSGQMPTDEQERPPPRREW